jgi:hypothetical protein
VSHDADITFAISLELSPPEFQSRFRHAPKGTGVAMPETTVDEDDFMAPGEDEVGPSGQAARVLAVPITKTMDETADRQLGAGVLAFDEAHALAALAGRKGIHGY